MTRCSLCLRYMFVQCRKTRRICQKVLQLNDGERLGAAFSFAEISHLRS